MHFTLFTPTPRRSNTRSLPNEKLRPHFHGLEVLLEYSECILGIEFLAGKHVEIYLVGLLTEVGCNIGCLNQLHESVPLLYSRTEANNVRVPIGNHINSFYKGRRELTDRLLRSNGMGITSCRIYD